MKMLFKHCTYILNCKVYINVILSRSSSSLFINGPKATNNFVYVTPHVDCPERLKNKNVVLNEIKRRQAKIDLNKLENLWSVYEELKVKKEQLVIKKEEVSKKLEELIKNKETGNSFEKLKIQLALLKENIKKLKVPFWSAEEAAILEALKLPNSLHYLTPDDKNKMIFQSNICPSNDKNHLKIGLDQDIIKFTDNENYYLKGDAAIFELGAKFYFSKILKENNFTQFSNTDFVKSLIIEACGKDHTNPDSTFILHHNEDTKVNTDSRLHLTGAGSIYSFFAYHTKNVLHNRAFPLKYFSMGRQYLPSPTKQESLLHVSQSSVVEIFIVAKDNVELDKIFNEVIDITKELYSHLGYHFQLSLVSANQLEMWESLRLAIQMYSSSSRSYVEVGNISMSGDFISKRLMFTYTEEKEHKFPHILSGTILNVPKLLACILEDDKDFVLPEQLRVENWSIKSTV